MLSFGVVGTKFGSNYIRTIQNELADIAQVTWICSKSSERYGSNTDKGRIFYTNDYKEICNNVRNIVIATPASTHYEICKYALEQNCNVICEKPFTLDYVQSLELNLIAKSKNLNLCVDHTDLWNGGYLKLKGQFNRKEITLIEYELGDWREQRLDVSHVFDWMPHQIAVVLDLLQKIPEIVSVEGNNDDVTVKLKAQNAAVRLRASRLMKHKMRYIDCWDEKQHWAYDDVKKNLGKNMGDDFSEESFDRKPPLTRLLEEFCAAVEAKEVRFNANLACDVVKMLEEIDKEIK